MKAQDLAIATRYHEGLIVARNELQLFEEMTNTSHPIRLEVEVYKPGNDRNRLTIRPDGKEQDGVMTAVKSVLEVRVRDLEHKLVELGVDVDSAS